LSGLRVLSWWRRLASFRRLSRKAPPAAPAAPGLGALSWRRRGQRRLMPYLSYSVKAPPGAPPAASAGPSSQQRPHTRFLQSADVHPCKTNKLPPGPRPRGKETRPAAAGRRPKRPPNGAGPPCATGVPHQAAPPPDSLPLMPSARSPNRQQASIRGDSAAARLIPMTTRTLCPRANNHYLPAIRRAGGWAACCRNAKGKRGKGCARGGSTLRRGPGSRRRLEGGPHARGAAWAATRRASVNPGRPSWGSRRFCSARMRRACAAVP
jgi:hypothetical protein